MALVLVMGVLVLVGGLLLWLGADQRAGEQPAGARHQGQTTQPEQPALAANPRTRSSSPVGAAEPLQNGTTPDLTLNGGGPRIAAPVDRFSGRGKIRGEVFMADHSTPPKVWTLSATPSKTLMGGDSAEPRQLEFLAGETRFVLENLPFGSYDLCASSASSNPRTMQVVLDRGTPNPFINLQMEPAGMLDGRIVDHEGLPAAGIRLVLVKLPGLETRRTRSDELGRYRFDAVLDSSYQLTVGELESPIRAKKETLRLQAPGMTLPDIELPKLATLDLRLVNEDGENLAEVIVRGAGIRGGSVDAKTNAFGKLQVPYLPAGRYRLRFQLEGYRVRRSPIDLSLDGPNAYAIELQRE